MKKLLIVTAGIAGFGAPAVGQELTYGQFGLSFTQIETTGDDVDVTELTGALDYRVNNFLFGFDFENEELAAGGLDASVSTYDISAGYEIVDGFVFGVSAGQTEIDDFSVFEIDALEAFAQYESGPVGGALLYGEYTGDVGDIEITTVFGEYNATPDLAFGVVFEQIDGFDTDLLAISADYATGPIALRAYSQSYSDDGPSLAGVKGAYSFTPLIAASAHIQSLDFFGSDLEAYEIGVDYRIANEVSLGASVGRLTDESDDFDFVNFGLTYEFGGQTRIDQRMIDDLDDDRSTLDGILIDLNLGAGFVN